MWKQWRQVQVYWAPCVQLATLKEAVQRDLGQRCRLRRVQRRICILLHHLSLGKLLPRLDLNAADPSEFPTDLSHLYRSLLDHDEHNTEPTNHIHCVGYRGWWHLCLLRCLASVLKHSILSRRFPSENGLQFQTLLQCDSCDIEYYSYCLPLQCSLRH